jgi:hypothetical protein
MSSRYRFDADTQRNAKKDAVALVRAYDRRDELMVTEILGQQQSKSQLQCLVVMLASFGHTMIRRRYGDEKSDVLDYILMDLAQEGLEEAE